MTLSRMLLSTFAAALCLASPGSGQSVNDLRLSPGDGVRVVVKDEPGLSGDFPVGLDGSVLFPLAGLIRVAERPFDQVVAELRASYGTELLEPVIQVTPLVRVAVVGEVRRPGLFSIDPTQSVMDVLATAGGLTPGADPERIVLVRDGTLLEIALDPGSPLLAMGLLSGDEITVRQKTWFKRNLGLLVGAVTSVTVAAATTLILR